ncbi:type IV secretion system protein VirB9 [Sphingomonas laterariae]|uniref:Type IV secretion system protein VirB9 n=1 Tax=Edaphosphingomonas laterariae TaxID=861865 RepID=A0A239J261_9SPHN|nr:P-type conjugative transfer protein TrbG [Sphingomonas laterariae]SNS99353.1 type IV secretion system protein VirB9 [Sphingomonas laterariae]
MNLLAHGITIFAIAATSPACATTTVSAGRVLSANREALREPLATRFTNARQVYAWSDGATYRLFALPERISDIALEPAEKLISVAAGDTARWMVGDTVSGDGSETQVHILVKPIERHLRTNMVITTDRRTYHLELDSGSAAAMAAVSWSYPRSALLTIRAPEPPAKRPPPPAETFDAMRLDFGYSISGDQPSWRPLRAFDDGRQTFIQFPASIAVSSAPPLFLLNAEGKAELVNYRMRGTYYVVDRLFETAELRLGEKRQTIVRITRTGRQKS